jgi:hypothetical protein
VVSASASPSWVPSPTPDQSGFLGEIEVAEEADQAGEGTAPLVLEDLVEGRYCSLSGRKLKPSDGLEPSTPSLPWNDSRNWSQPTATVFA